tara:strand:- start:1117 stop:1302 length:186 start_codon:yes stop_codon:yes gene_type:complete
MKIKIKDKEKPIIKKWCFGNTYDSSLIEKLNSGKQVEVDMVPNIAWEYVEEVKTKKKKESK